jgi:hypothetical protein
LIHSFLLLLASDRLISPGLEKAEKGDHMPNDSNRVLTRRGARQLSKDEIEQTTGAGATLLSVIVTNTAGNPDQRLDS